MVAVKNPKHNSLLSESSVGITRGIGQQDVFQCYISRIDGNDGILPVQARAGTPLQGLEPGGCLPDWQYRARTQNIQQQQLKQTCGCWLLVFDAHGGWLMHGLLLEIRNGFA